MDSFSDEVTIILVGCTFFLLVAIGIIILIQVHQKKQLHFLFEKKELQNRYTEELLKNRIEAQEETLNNVSKEIHDNIGQLVSSAKLLVGTAQRKMPDVGDTLQQAELSLSQAIQELRSLSKSLNSEWLEQFNFFENLRSEALRINATKEINLTISHQQELVMSKENQLILFRMVQESFQNSIKHGQATHINITAEEKDQESVIIIEDNGTGFDPTDTTRQGFGILNMKNRVSLLGGQAQWQSDNTGTTVTINIPR